MMTKEEFKKTYIRMIDFYRKQRPFYDETKGRPNCSGLPCSEFCPFYTNCCNVDGESIQYNAFEAIEIVEKWGKEHPIITRADKYKEVFGAEPKYIGGSFICPGIPRDQDYCDSHTCEECKSNYWNEEYVEPEKENKNV